MNQQIRKQLDFFHKSFKQFIKPHQCRKHFKNPIYVCIEKQCKIKGLVCQQCLSSGIHKNHDSMDILKFLTNNLSVYRKDVDGEQIQEIIHQIQETYSQMIMMVNIFIQKISCIVKKFIQQKNKFHQSRENLFNVQRSIERLKNCEFDSIEELNENLKFLGNKLPINNKNKNVNKDENCQKIRSYLQDLNYQNQFLISELKKIQNTIQNIFQVKHSHPIVKTVKPTFVQPTFINNPDFIYIGQAKEETPHGKGIFYSHTTQKIIFGEFSNGFYEGKCQQYNTDGDYYYGQFKKNKKFGRGFYQWGGRINNTYQGQFQDCKRNGKGIFKWIDGSRYEGNFKNNNQDGFGIMYRKDGTIQYEGNWVNGMFQGYGIQYYQSGQKYQGEFKKDKIHGKGIFYKNDSIIRGLWKQNELVYAQSIKAL